MKRIAASLILAWVTSCSEQSAPKTETALWRIFEAETLSQKYSPRFARVTGQGARANVKITPPGRTFKDFTLRGDATDEAIREIVSGLKADLLALAQTSGAKVVQPPNASGPDRPAALPYAPFKELYVKDLQGFHVAYAQDGIEGGVDVLAGHGIVEGKKEWMLVCSIHEAR